VDQAFGEYAGKEEGREVVMRIKSKTAYGGYKVLT